MLKQINTHIIAAAKENEVLKDQVGSPVERTNYLQRISGCIHQKPGPKRGENLQVYSVASPKTRLPIWNKKRAPQNRFSPWKTGGEHFHVELCWVVCCQTSHPAATVKNGSMSKLATLSTSAASPPFLATFVFRRWPVECFPLWWWPQPLRRSCRRACPSWLPRKCLEAWWCQQRRLLLHCQGLRMTTKDLGVASMPCDCTACSIVKWHNV